MKLTERTETTEKRKRKKRKKSQNARVLVKINHTFFPNFIVFFKCGNECRFDRGNRKNRVVGYTDRQTNKQTDKQTNRQTNKQTNRQTDNIQASRVSLKDSRYPPLLAKCLN